MSILSTAVIAASIFSTSFAGSAQAQINAKPVDIRPQTIVQEKVQNTVQINKRLQALIKQSGITIDSIKDCIVIPPSCDIPGYPGNDDSDNNKPGGTDTPDDTNKPDGGDQPEDTNKPGGNDKPDDTNKPGGGAEDGSEDTNQSFAAQVVSLVNEERAKNNLAPLTMDASLSAAAMTRANEITVSFSHTRPDGSSFSTAIKEQGIQYRTSGENIAWGQRTPQQVMDGWMNSAGHRANILNPDFGTIGIGYYVQNGTPYWVQLFTN